MSNKQSAKIKVKNEWVSFYFELAENGMIQIWAKTTMLGFYRVDRYGTKLSRDWIRAFAAESNLEVKFN